MRRGRAPRVDRRCRRGLKRGGHDLGTCSRCRDRGGAGWLFRRRGSVRAQLGVFGSVASDPKVSRLASRWRPRPRRAEGINVGGVDTGPRGGLPEGQASIDMDPSSVTAQSERRLAAPTIERGLELHPLFAIVDDEEDHSRDDRRDAGRLTGPLPSRPHLWRDVARFEAGAWGSTREVGSELRKWLVHERLAASHRSLHRQHPTYHR